MARRERRRLEPDPDDVVEMAAFTAHAIGASEAATFVVALDGTVVSWSQAAERLFRRPAWAALGRPCHEVVRGLHPDGCAACRRSCPVRLDARLGRSPASYDLLVPAATTGRTRTRVRAHHVTLRDPLGHACGLLHVLEPVGRGPGTRRAGVSAEQAAG